MSIFKPLRKFYIKLTDFTHGYQGNDKKLAGFYKAWSYCYDFSVNLDPAFNREMKSMITSAVKPGDTTLDIGGEKGVRALFGANHVKLH